jgi:hypothetical protein
MAPHTDTGPRLGDALSCVSAAIVDTATLGHHQLERLARDINRVRNALDRLSVAVTRRADELHAGAPRAGEDLWHRAGSDPGGDRAAGDGDGDGAADGDGDGDGGPRGPAPDPDEPAPRLDPDEARRQAGRAQVCTELPRVGHAFDRAQITASHLDTLARLLRRLDLQLRRRFVMLDADIAAAATTNDPHGLRVWCTHQIERLARELGRGLAEQQRRDTKLATWTDQISGMTRLSGQFHPELGQRITTVLDAEIARLKAAAPDDFDLADLAGPHPDSAADRDHLAAHALAGLVLGAHRQNRPAVAELCVIVDDHTLTCGPHADTIAEYTNGDQIDIATLQRLACTARLHRIILGPDGVPLDVGRAARLATHEQRMALRALYRTCAWPGCRVSFDRCTIHHLDPWVPDGDTDLDNLLPLCGGHHHRTHHQGYLLILAADRALTITTSDGTPYLTAPPPTLRPARPPGSASEHGADEADTPFAHAS